jgi:hypothetical protein
MLPLRAPIAGILGNAGTADYKFDARDDECEKLVTGALQGRLLSSNGIEVD